MTVFMINLARRPDRLAHMRRQLADFERVEAVDGEKKIGVENRGTAEGLNLGAEVARFRFLCAKGYAIKSGEIGCAMSHQSVYRTILARGLDMACVLEDDVTLCSDFAARIEALAPQLRTDAPTVLSFAETGAGYLLNRAAAELLLRLNSPIRSTVDDWVRWQRGGLVWRKLDGLVTLSPYGDPRATGIGRSDIIGDARHFVANMSVGRKLVYRICRVFGKTMDLILS